MLTTQKTILHVESVAYTTLVILHKASTLEPMNNKVTAHFLSYRRKWYYEVHIDSVQVEVPFTMDATDTSLGVDEYATSKGIFFSS